MAQGREQGRERVGLMLPVWAVYVVSAMLIAAGLGLPWIVRWSGIVRGEAGAAETAPVRKRPPADLRPVMLRLPAGEFTMGSDGEVADDDEKPVRRVYISEFELCETEVTQLQYEAVMGTKPSLCQWGCGRDRPVQNVSFRDAVDYLNRLTEIENRARAYARKPSGVRLPKLSQCYTETETDVTWKKGCTGYRLPTEAEWEYAARADSTTAYSFGDDPGALGEYAWYDKNSNNQVQPVASKKPNAWGLHDMHGNVWEWVWDYYAPYKESREVERDPTGPPAGDPTIERIGDEPTRGLRGGGFDYVARLLRSAVRYWDRPSGSNGNFGFRCARGVPRASIR